MKRRLSCSALLMGCVLVVAVWANETPDCRTPAPEGGGSETSPGGMSGHGHALQGGGGGLGSASGRAATDPLIGLIDPGGGSVLESVTDFALPSKGASAVQWRHWRGYDQRSSGPGDTNQGYNWFHPYLQSLSLTGSPNADSDVVWRKDAHHTHTFAETGGSYVFSAATTTFGKLTHEHARDPADTYRIEFPDGTILVFYDFDHGSSNEKGKLRYIEDVYGNRLTVTYQGGNTGRIDTITDASGHFIQYTYLTAGDNSGKLDYIRVYKENDAPASDSDLIARIEFTYKATSDGNHAESGNIGDLIKVVVKTHETDETGTSWSIARTTHYRYYSNASSLGDDHQLKMILRPEHYQRCDDDAGFGAPETASDANVDDYATWQFEFDNAGSARTTKMIGAAGGGSCGGCGGSGGDHEGVYVFSYATQVDTNRNSWATRAKVEHKVGATVMWTRYIDCNIWGEVYKDILITDDGDHTKPLWGTQYDRDTSTGEVTAYYTSSSISDYDSSTHAFTYVGDGQVLVYTYDSSAKRIASARLYKQSEYPGTPSAGRYVGLWEYAAAPATVAYRSTRYVLDKSYSYPSETTSSTDASRLTTDYDYICHPDTGDLDGDANTSEETDRPMVIRTIHPTVTTGQNGPNSAAERFTYTDTAGVLRWTKDEEGAVHYQSYEALNGLTAFSFRDVNTGSTSTIAGGVTDPDGSPDEWVAWSGTAPNATGGAFNYDFRTTGGVGLATKRSFDWQGRVRKTTSPTGMITYIAHLDGETRTYGAWNAGTDKPLLPIQRQLTDKDGRTGH